MLTGLCFAILLATHSNSISNPQRQFTINREIINLDSQPFYKDLESIYADWEEAPISIVTAESPKETLLNFYAVMAHVGNKIKKIMSSYKSDPGFNWSKKKRKQIDEAERLFKIAVNALDASGFQASVRKYLADEATRVNFSRHNTTNNKGNLQGLDLKLNIDNLISPEQVQDLLDYLRTFTEKSLST